MQRGPVLLAAVAVLALFAPPRRVAAEADIQKLQQAEFSHIAPEQRNHEQVSQLDARELSCEMFVYWFTTRPMFSFLGSDATLRGDAWGLEFDFYEYIRRQFIFGATKAKHAMGQPGEVDIARIPVDSPHRIAIIGA